MKNNQSLINLIREAYDLHVHMGPEVIPRKYNTPEQLMQSLSGKVAGVALKNHFFSTVPIAAMIPAGKLKVVGSVVLNNFVGGLNPDAIYAASTLAKDPFIVWFPTVSAKQFLNNSTWEIAPEWVDKNAAFSARKANDIVGIRLLDENNKLTSASIAILRAIKQTDAILATGHISWQESRALIQKAATMGIKRMIVTHPIYQRIAMPISIQKELASFGAKIEQCWSMWKIDNIPMNTIAGQIKAIGATNCIISSDSGQSFSSPPNQALYNFCEKLLKEGVSLKELKTMCMANPKKLIFR